MGFIINLLKFFIILIKKAREIWIIEILYPKIYTSGKIKSLVNREILTSSKGLFIEKGVIIKNINLKIGNYTYIGNNTLIDSCLSIGSYCSISSDVKVGLRNHPLNSISTSPVFYSSYRMWSDETTFDEKLNKTVIIDDDVLISANVLILNGVHIGRGAVIGAGAVVTKDIPPYAIVMGIPAKIVRYRFNIDLIKEIEDSKWWEKGEDILKKYISLSNNPKAFISKIINNC
jgi:acetyltransferase-like isoleucine patch superfamily enzyme